VSRSDSAEWWLLLSMAVAASPLLVSCAYTNAESPVIGQLQSDSATMKSVHDPVAEGMVACLGRGSVVADAVPSGDGDSAAMVVLSDTYRSWVMSVDGVMSMSPNSPDQSDVAVANAVAERAWSQVDGTTEGPLVPSYLVIDGVDYTSMFLECLDETGYKQSLPDMTPQDEMREKTQRAAAGSDWAACARDNGFPLIADPTAPLADGYRTMPDVEIPDTIGEDELSKLLESCPEVGAKQLEQQRQSSTSDLSEAEYAKLFFRVPSLVITTQCLEFTVVECTGDQFDHLDALRTILVNHELMLNNPADQS